jgi:cell division protein FtsL
MKRQKKAGKHSNPPIPVSGQRHFSAFFRRQGPVALSVTCVLIISLMAILYVSQLGQAMAINQQIQDLHGQQSILQRQNNDLANTVASEQSPAYIAAQAAAQGLQPANSQNTQTIVIPRVQSSP